MSIDSSSASSPPLQWADAAAPLRAFYALWPDAQARRLVAQTAAEVARRAQGRAARSENLHLTVAFVGEAEADQLDALRAIGAAVAAGASGCTLMLDRIGSFRGTGIAWLGPTAIPEALVQLAADLDARLRRAGFPTERRAFAPHVSLARHCTQVIRRNAESTSVRVEPVEATLDPRSAGPSASSAQAPRQAQGERFNHVHSGSTGAALPAPIAWRVDAMTLTASTLTPRGPDYRNLARWPLPQPDR